MMTSGGYTKEQAMALQTFAGPAARMKPGEARVGEPITPFAPISVNGAEPKFEPGDILTVREVTGVGGCLVRVEDEWTGKRGMWAVDCFTRL